MQGRSSIQSHCKVYPNKKVGFLDKLISLGWILILLGIAFFLTDIEYLSDNCNLFSINVNKMNWIILIASICFILTVFKTNNLKIDIISILLLARIPICLISTFYIASVYSSTGRILIQVLIALVYFIGINFNGSKKFIVLSCVSLAIVISVQTIIQSYSIPYQITDAWYSYFMRIPAGASNVIASFITGVAIIFVYYQPKRFRNKIVKYGFLSLFIYAIYLTSSTGSMFLFLFVSLIIIFERKFSFIGKNSIKFIFFYISLILILFIFVVILLGNVDVEELTHNRIGLIQSGIEEFSRNPLFGVGMNYTQMGFSGSHNIIIEVLRESGLIGFVAFFIPLFMIVVKCFNILNKRKEGRDLALLIIMMLGHMMFESSYFNYANDAIFWFLCGMIKGCLYSDSLDRALLTNKYFELNNSIRRGTYENTPG